MTYSSSVYKHLVYSRRFDDEIYMSRDEKYTKHLLSPRNLMMEFIQDPNVEWFIEQGIPLSIETYKDIEAMQTQADMFASFTYEQLELWREKKIIDKLQNSYNTNMSKEDYPF